MHRESLQGPQASLDPQGALGQLFQDPQAQHQVRSDSNALSVNLGASMVIGLTHNHNWVIALHQQLCCVLATEHHEGQVHHHYAISDLRSSSSTALQQLNQLTRFGLDCDAVYATVTCKNGGAVTGFMVQLVVPNAVKHTQ